MNKLLRAAFAGLTLLASLSSALAQTGFSDGFSSGALMGWNTEGSRVWSVINGRVKPQTGNEAGFLIGKYPCSDNGTVEVDVNADQWNGHMAGVVFRYNSPSSFYYVAVKPGNQWDNAVYFCKNTTDISSGTVLARNFTMSPQLKLKVEINNETFEIYVDNTLKGTVTDNSISSGYTGLAHSTYWESIIDFDNFTWTDQPGSIPTIAPVNPCTPIDPNSIEVYTKDEAITESNIIKPRWYVKNNGTKAIRDFKVYYYISVTAGHTPLLEDYYTPDCNVTLDRITDVQFRLTIDYSGKTLNPGQVTPDLSGSVVGIYYSDPSMAIDKAGSFSCNTSAGFLLNPNAPVVTACSPVPVSGTTPPVTVKSKTLRIVKLKCNESEDATGDECILDVYRDGSVISTFNHDMEDGDEWTLNEELPLKGNMEIKLTDEDGDVPFDDNDFLGTVVIDKNIGLHTGTFTLDGADYTLDYEVFESTSVVTGTRVETVKILTINTLHCHEQEDVTGDDHALLRVSVDGKYVSSHLNKMDKGELWQIGASYEMSSSASLQLYDKDDWDDDDDLGTVVINVSEGNHTGEFTGDGAHYTVDYTISVSTRTVSVKTDLEIAIENFENSTKPGYWPHINKADLIEDIKSKVNSGELPSQSVTPMCGPASIEYFLIKQNPVKFVEICQRIYEDLSFRTRTRSYSISSDQDVLQEVPPSTFTDNHWEADWMFMAFLRDEANWVMDVEAYPPTDAYGITNPWQMKEWAYEILGFNTIDVDFSFIFGELEMLEEASRITESGGVAFLLVDGYYLQGDPYPVYFPNHWVTLTAKADIDWGEWYNWDSGNVKFQIFSWGEIKDWDISEEDFENILFGTVTGK